MKALAIGTILVALLAGPARASQCPLLIKQVNEAVDHRLAGEDVAGSKARKLAKEAEALHNEGRHTEAVAKAEEAAKAIGLALKKVKEAEAKVGHQEPSVPTIGQAC